MRHLVLPVTFGLTACGTPVPCTLADCAASCPDVAAAAESPPGKVPWRGWHVATLQPELDALRAGITFTGPGLVCARSTLCTTDVRDPQVPLLSAKDPFDVVVTVTVPPLTRDGDWKGTFQEFCSPWIDGVRESLEHPSHIEWPVALPLARGEPVTLVAHGIDPTPYPFAQRCAWRLQFVRTDGLVSEIHGRYELESPHPQPSHSLSLPVDEPPAAPEPTPAPDAPTAPTDG